MPRILDVRMQGLGGSDQPRSFSFKHNINVIFGDNGSGKSTLLRMLVSALRNDVDLIGDSPVTEAAVSFASYQFETTIQRRLVQIPLKHWINSRQMSLVDVDSRSREASDQNWTWSWVSEGDGTDEVLNETYACNFLPVSRLYRTALSAGSRRPLSEGKDVNEPSLEATFVNRFNQRWSIYSNQLLAEVQQIQQEGLATIIQTVMFQKIGVGADATPPGDPDAAFSLASSFFQRQPELRHLMQREREFKNLYSGNPALRAVIRNIEVVEAKIADVQKRRSFLNSVINELFKNKTVLLGDSGISIVDRWGSQLTLEKLSTGEKQLLVMFIEVLSDSASILVIDEPEISLHIAWQNRLLRTLNELSPKTQIVVATHSPEIMAEIDDDCIFRV